MSPMLVVALLALVIVVSLTLLQRRAHAQPGAPRREATPPGPPPGPARATDLRTDPLLGPMTFTDGMWMAEDDLNLGGIAVLVELSGTIDGPTEEDRAVVRAALAQPDLEGRARALVQAELERRGIDANGITIYELAVGPDEDDVRTGYIWYSVPHFAAEIGVSSVDGWRTLVLEVIE